MKIQVTVDLLEQEIARIRSNQKTSPSDEARLALESHEAALAILKASTPQPRPSPSGWECSRCGTVHASWVDRCSCPPIVTVTQSSSTESRE